MIALSRAFKSSIFFRVHGFLRVIFLRRRRTRSIGYPLPSREYSRFPYRRDFNFPLIARPLRCNSLSASINISRRGATVNKKVSFRHRSHPLHYMRCVTNSGSGKLNCSRRLYSGCDIACTRCHGTVEFHFCYLFGVNRKRIFIQKDLLC